MAVWSFGTHTHKQYWWQKDLDKNLKGSYLQHYGKKLKCGIGLNGPLFKQHRHDRLNGSLLCYKPLDLRMQNESGSFNFNFYCRFSYTFPAADKQCNSLTANC